MCLLLYSCLLLPFFSHIADLPGLACLNHLSAEVKSKRNIVCDCTTAAHALRGSEELLGKTGYGARMVYKRALLWSLAGTSMCAAGNRAARGVFRAAVKDKGILSWAAQIRVRVAFEALSQSKCGDASGFHFFNSGLRSCCLPHP